ncbi:CoA-transferase family III domain-containing protein [Dactylonectria macrodidyma]|uniref:CoA-transferase family III domain-containing protein n=1 Tax=Dactylonectria macrodidyma TaxID=307937 RepID=A0A9P9J1Q5_9HYPO|nr:CoA-transferase family III domain-containing protein [Dactylonectria macrodidyma]
MSAGPPLNGIRVVELAGLAPGPFCGQLLSSYGASVLRIDRPDTSPHSDILTSYKSSVVLDLKSQLCISLLKSILRKADVLIDPFRPGVLEKLDLDPSALTRDNPRLIVIRLTGYRRDGKYKDLAGHDINYLAVSGLLSMLGARGEPPSPPANILGDYAGGGLVAFSGVVLALIHRSTSGKGQVVEATMVDGAGYLGTIPRLRTKEPVWSDERGTNLLDGGCPYYRCYECKDAGKYMSVGALEPQFFANLLRGLNISPKDIGHGNMKRDDKRNWPHMYRVFENRFKKKTRREWEAIFDDMDACVVPVLEYGELEEAEYPQRPLIRVQSHSTKTHIWTHMWIHIKYTPFHQTQLWIYYHSTGARPHVECSGMQWIFP